MARGVTFLLKLTIALLPQEIKVPAKERGHKGLGRWNATMQLLQLNLLFIVGQWTTLEATGSVYHTRLLMANYGLAYSLEVSNKLFLSPAFMLSLPYPFCTA